MTKVLDYRSRGWGHDYNIMNVDHDTHEMKLGGWHTPLPNEGDLMFLSNGKGGAPLYRLLDVQPCGNPSDMYSARAEFIARNEQLTAEENALAMKVKDSR